MYYFLQQGCIKLFQSDSKYILCYKNLFQIIAVLLTFIFIKVSWIVVSMKINWHIKFISDFLKYIQIENSYFTF